MKTRLFFLLFIITVLSENIFAQTIDSPNANYIEVTGSAEMYIIPNEIYLSIELRTNETKDNKALTALETTLKNIVGKFGMPSECLFVIDARSSENSIWFIFKQNVARTKLYTLKITDPNIIPSVFNELINNGITDIAILKTTHSNIAEFKKQVKIEAMKAAKEKASYLLSSVDQVLGKLIYVRELSEKEIHDNNFIVPYSISNNILKKIYAESSPKESFEKIHIRYEIIARFEIK
jgi:hypothetical protein